MDRQSVRQAGRQADRQTTQGSDPDVHSGRIHEMNPIVRQAAANGETYSTHTYRGFSVNLRTCSQLDKLTHGHTDTKTSKLLTR